jgi:hypothetical protein
MEDRRGVRDGVIRILRHHAAQLDRVVCDRHLRGEIAIGLDAEVADRRVGILHRTRHDAELAVQERLVEAELGEPRRVGLAPRGQVAADSHNPNIGAVWRSRMSHRGTSVQAQYGLVVGLSRLG